MSVEPGVNPDAPLYPEKSADALPSTPTMSWEAIPEGGYPYSTVDANNLVYPVVDTALLPGVPGQRGPRGNPGPQGLQGAQGSQGSQGAQGIQGVKGDTGLTGSTGDTGPSGVIGVDAGELTNTGTSTAAQLGLASVGSAGTYPKVTTDAFGRVTAGASLTAGDIPNIAESQVTNLTTDLAAKADATTIAKWSGGSSTVVETAPRINLNLASLTSGTVSFSFFTPLVTVTVGTVSMAAATTAASGLTLARMGLYTFDETTATLVARTASDTTLFTVASTLYTRSFDTTGGYPATYTLQAGQRYALAVICVGTTMPNVYYEFASAAFLSVLTPRMSATATSLTDLPTSRATFTNNAGVLYGRFS